MKIARVRILVAATVALLVSAPVVVFAQPTIEEVILAGGPGDQYAQSLTEASGGVFGVGWDNAANEGMYFGCQVPLTVPDWLVSMGYRRGPGAVTLIGPDAYIAGWALPPYCGASDGRGDTEGKPVFYLYDDAGNYFGCNSANFFRYRGGEYYQTIQAEPGGDLFAAGYGEEMGWGGFRTILASYRGDGTLLWKRRYATDLAGNHLGGTYVRIGSRTEDLAWLDGYLYLAGSDRDATHVGGPAGQAMLLKVDALAESPDTSPSSYASNLYPVWSRLAGVASMFRGALAFDGHVYAVGSTFAPGGCEAEDPLVEKYDPAGNLIWSANPVVAGGAGLWDMVAVNERLFAVGFLDASCNGDADAWIAEVDPQNGTISTTNLWGGDSFDRARHAASDGERLFVYGETRSFSEGGNAPGELDVFVLQLSVAPPDSDGDGVEDDVDACPGTAAGDVVAADGCSIAQRCPCDAEWKNHGAYVACVAHAAEVFVELGLISDEAKDEVVSLAAQSRCGKKKP